MYKVITIKNYEFTRDIIVESKKSKQQYIVFDDSDLVGNDQFSFVREQEIYDCKLGILGEVTPSGKTFNVLSKEKIGKMNLLKISNSDGDNFYLSAATNLKIGSQIKLSIKRYDLLSVNNVINDRTLWIAIDHQLGRKDTTNTLLLEKILANNLDSSEFFINKAIGWSLREYSKTNPEWVMNFVETYYGGLKMYDLVFMIVDLRS